MDGLLVQVEKHQSKSHKGPNDNLPFSGFYINQLFQLESRFTLSSLINT